MTSCAPVDPLSSAAPRLMTWGDLLARPRPVADKSFRYGPDPHQVVDLWRPAGPGPHPVVVMIHGGCWTTSIADRTLMDWAAADLRARGIAVWNIDYRGVDRPGGEHRGIFDDVALAADLLREHSATYRLDIGSLVAVGHSAGGHLALWLATRPHYKDLFPDEQVDTAISMILAMELNPISIAHVVSLGGLPDLEQALSQKQGCGREPILKLIATASFSGNLEDAQMRRAMLQSISIPLMAPLGVPQTLVNGDADKIIPTHFANDYAAKMRAAGDDVDVRIVPNQGHVELIAPGTPAWAAVVEAIERALGRKPTTR